MITHWSKEHAEHLRTVHFSLIAASAAVLIVVFSTKSYKPDRAVNQISSILMLKNNWKTGNAKNNLGPLERDAAGVLSAETGVGKCDFLKTEGLVPNVYRINWHGNWKHYFGPYDDHYHSLSWDPQPPDNLIGIRLWWEGFTQKPTFYAPDTLDPIVRVEENKLIGRMTCANTGPASTRVVNVFPGYITSEGDSLIFVGFMDGAVAGRLKFTLRQYAQVIATQETLLVRSDDPPSTILLRNIKPGSFSQSFSDLTRATEDLQFAKLDDVKSYLFSQMGKDEILELLGLKIPLPQLTIWGISVLLGTQTLFMIYLRQLAGKLGTSDPAWDVLWMGLDQSRFAEVVFFVTSVILPCLAVATLSLYSISQIIILDFNDSYNPAYWQWNWSGLLFFKGLILAALTVFSCRFGRAIWNYRPTITTASGIATGTTA